MTEGGDGGSGGSESNKDSNVMDVTPSAATPLADIGDDVVDNGAIPAALPAGVKLPENRFELELEFVQSLASPAYLHFLATNGSDTGDNNWLDDPAFLEYLKYLLRTWTQPEYSRFLVYPQALYFLEWLINNHRREEWAQVAFRNFAHQQQFHSWQHRATRLYGRGEKKSEELTDTAGQDSTPQNEDGATTTIQQDGQAAAAGGDSTNTME